LPAKGETVRCKATLVISGVVLGLLGGAVRGAIVVAPSPATSGAPELSYDAGTVRFLATSAQTGGSFAVVELAEKPGYTTPPHRHDHMDETFYVLEGRLRVTMDGSTVDHPQGSFVIVPRGKVHSQGSGTDGPVRVLITLTPGGFEAFFAGRVELARHTRRGEPAFVEGMSKLLLENAQWIQPGDVPVRSSAMPGKD
jgi:quercetin dioxygenase-like cupin family protein